jgi:hypothetical protein
MDKSDTLNEAASRTREAISAGDNAARQTVNASREAVDAGYENAREYARSGLDYAAEVSDGIADFVQRQPWIALAGAFVVGYIAAKALRRLSA